MPDPSDPHQNHSTPETGDTVEWEVHDGGSASRGQAADLSALPLFGDEAPEGGEAAFSLDIKRFIVGVVQRLWIAVIVFLVITVLMVGLIATGISHNWQATTTLIKRSHQDRLTLAERDPFKSQEYSLATLLDTLKLPSSLQRVIDSSGLEATPTQLATALDVSLSRDSTILNLMVTWGDPYQAAELANLVATQFIVRTRRLIQEDAAEAYEYYSGQLDSARRDAQGAADAVQAFRDAHGISDLTTETKVLLTDLSRLRGEYNAKVAENNALKAVRDRLAKTIEEEPEQVITYTIYRSPLKNRLADYEWELQEALAKYTPENPKVVKLKERILALEQMIEASNDEAVPENTYAPNTKRLEMELRLQEIGDNIRLLDAQVIALASTLEEMQKKVSMLSAREKDFIMLQSRLESILSLETQLARRVEETRLVMQRNDASFDIVENATPPQDPLPSGRKLLAIASVILASGAGLFLVLVLEFIDPAVRSLRDASDIVGNENCVEIPELDENDSSLLDPNAPISALANVYRRLCNDMDTAAERPRAPIGVISLHSGEGRSTITANLASTRLMKGQSVLVVDADLRSAAGARPTDLLDLETSRTGLFEHLVEGHPLETHRDSEKFSYIAAAQKPLEDDRGLVALGAADLAGLIGTLSGRAFTLVDLPPVVDLELALELAGQMGQVVLVVRAGKTRRDELKACVAQLSRRNIECVGTVVIEVEADRLATAPLVPVPDFGALLNRFKRKPAHA